jgi:hypothetical protein
MLLLTSSSDQLQVVTAVAAAIDIHASWVDITPSTSTIVPGRLNTSLTTPSTASVAGSPAASTQRNVKALHVFNKDASATCGVTLQTVDATGTYPFFSASLTPGSMIEVTDMGGIRVLQS